MFINSLLSESRCLFYKTDKTTSFSWGVIQIIKIRYLNLWASEDWVFCKLTGNCTGDWWRRQRKGKKYNNLERDSIQEQPNLHLEARSKEKNTEDLYDLGSGINSTRTSQEESTELPSRLPLCCGQSARKRNLPSRKKQ